MFPNHDLAGLELLPKSSASLRVEMLPGFQEGPGPGTAMNIPHVALCRLTAAPQKLSTYGINPAIELRHGL